MEIPMERDIPLLKETQAEFAVVVKWILSGLIEAFFIVCWVLTQWAVNEYVLVPFAMDGIDKTVLNIAQWLFAIATLAPIFLHLLQLIATMSVRTYRNVQKELKK